MLAFAPPIEWRRRNHMRTVTRLSGPIRRSYIPMVTRPVNVRGRPIDWPL